MLLRRLTRCQYLFRHTVVFVVPLTHMPKEVVAVDVMHAGEALDRALTDIYGHAMSCLAESEPEPHHVDWRG